MLHLPLVQNIGRAVICELQSPRSFNVRFPASTVYDRLMSLIARIVIAAGLLGSTPPLPAEPAPPATAAIVDLSTPRGTLRTLNHSMREGDVELIKRLFLATTPEELQMVDADAQMALALANLRDAAIKAFGAENATVLTGDTSSGAAESLARIESAEIIVSGDNATVRYSDSKEIPFILKKVEGQWRVPVSQLGKPLNPAALEQRIADLAIQRRVVQDIAGQIRAGKFSSSEKAREAWQSRILQAATSQPGSPEKG